MGCGTEPQREAEFVKKTVGVTEETLFGFFALLHNTENWPFWLFEARLEGLISSLLISPSFSIFKLRFFKIIPDL